MADLATMPNLEGRLGRSLTAAEQARAAALLADASALIRAYTGQTFDLVTNDTITLRPVGVHLRLPQRPVNTVHEVVAVGGAPIPDLVLPAGSWAWDRIDLIELFPLDTTIWVSLPQWWDNRVSGPDTYRVKYDHGYATVPPDVVAVACRVVLGALLAPTLAQGLVSERIGQYSYQFGQQAGAGSPGATVRLSDADRDDLARYRRTATTIAVRAR